MKKVKQLILGAILVAPLAMNMACSSSNNGSGGGSSQQCGGVGSTGPQSTVDIAVGDEFTDSDGANSIFVYLDILANADTAGGGDYPTADIILNNFASAVGSPVSSPEALFMTTDDGTNGGDLYVSSNNNSEILIWRNYVAQTSGSDADVMLDNVGGITDINDPTQLIVDADDNLVISDDNASSVFVYNNASALTGNGGDIADVELTGNACTNFDSCVNNPSAIAISTDDGTTTGGDLFVANGSIASTGDPIVSIYRDVNALTTNQDPDAGLTDDVSFFDLSSNFGCQAQDVLVDHNVLFVALDGNTDTCSQVFVFDGADGLATDGLPDAILFGNDTYIKFPFALESVDVAGTNPTLLVGSRKDWSSATDGPALSAFGNWFDSAGAFALTTGQSADVAVSDVSSNLNKTITLLDSGGALFAVGSSSAEDSFPWDLYVFRNVQGSGVCDSMAPNIIIPASGLNSNATDDYISLYGTFGNIERYNSLAAAVRNTTTTF